MARGRERDRRLAARRAVQPARRADRPERHGLEGIGPLDLRRSICTVRSARAPAISSASAGTAPPPGCRSRPSSSEPFAEAFAGARRRRARRCRPSAGDHDRRDRAGPRADARPRAGARPARAVRARQPRADAAGRERARPSAASTVGEGKHLRFRIRQHERDGGSAIAFGLGSAARPAPAARPLRRRVPA